MLNRDYDIAYIRKYVEGKLSPKQMNELERAAHADQMLMDLILGVESEKENQSAFPKEELSQRILKRSTEKKQSKIYVWKRIAIAASLLFIVSFSFYIFRNQHQEDKTFSSAETAVTRDSVRNVIAQSKSSKVDSSWASDSLTDTRLAFAPSTEKTPLPPAPTESKIKDQEEQTENILADIVADSPKLAGANAPSSIRMQEVTVNASAPQAKRSAETTNEPIRIRGMSTIPSANEKATVVFGRVIDSRTERPLSDVHIKDLVSQKTASTDDKGNFIVLSNEDSVKLDIQYIGYERQLIVGKTSGLEIRLQPEENALEEVVVSGYGKIEIRTKSVPAVGWEAFDEYLVKRAKETQLSNGTVTLKFDINESGRPINIHVEKSVDSSHDNAAIDILKQGPDWKPGKKYKGLKLKIRFKK